MTALRAGAATDVGRVRQINEDRYLADDGLFAVADGVGGHQAGEVAAQTSVETLRRAFTDHTAQGLVEAVMAANQAVWELAQGNSEKRGMGTTLTAMALVTEDGDEQLALTNVGDSRAYLLQQGELVQLTEDHSLVAELERDGRITAEEAQVHPQRSIITRALGMEPAIEVDCWKIIPYRGDRILLCSDGLTNELSNDRIASTLRQLADPQEAARDLVRQARAEGGGDNITVVVVDVVDDGGRAEEASAALAESPERPAPVPPPLPPTEAQVVRPARPSTSTATATRARTPAPTPPVAAPRRFTWRVLAFCVLVLAVFAAVTLSVGWYARSAYFVGLDGDRVAIFRGRPGGLLWFEPTLQERKPLTLGDVLPVHHNELRRGKAQSSKAAADRYVNNLRQEAEARTAAGTTTTTTVAPPGPP